MEKNYRNRNKQVLLLLVIGFSAELVGQMFGITKMRISQIKKKESELYYKLLKARIENIDKLMEMYEQLAKL